jgi:hypothetical protein
MTRVRPIAPLADFVTSGLPSFVGSAAAAVKAFAATSPPAA